MAIEGTGGNVAPAEGDLRNLLQARATRGLGPLLDVLNDTWLPAARKRFNSEFSPRYFGRTASETVSTAKRELSGFRARAGALIEFGIAWVLDRQLEEEHRSELRLTFNVVTEFPDLYLRDLNSVPLLRVDVKMLHDESDEYSARFRLPREEIQDLDDLLLYGAWKWSTATYGEVELTFPEIEESLLVPAAEIAEERDRRTSLTKGKFQKGAPMVLSRDKSYVPDTNFGKIDRIVHQSRRDSEDLTPSVRAFLQFADRHADKLATPTEDPTPPS